VYHGVHIPQGVPQGVTWCIYHRVVYTWVYFRVVYMQVYHGVYLRVVYKQVYHGVYLRGCITWV